MDGSDPLYACACGQLQTRRSARPQQFAHEAKEINQMTASSAAVGLTGLSNFTLAALALEGMLSIAESLATHGRQRPTVPLRLGDASVGQPQACRRGRSQQLTHEAKNINLGIVSSNSTHRGLSNFSS